MEYPGSGCLQGAVLRLAGHDTAQHGSVALCLQGDCAGLCSLQCSCAGLCILLVLLCQGGSSCCCCILSCNGLLQLLVEAGKLCLMVFCQVLAVLTLLVQLFLQGRGLQVCSINTAAAALVRAKGAVALPAWAVSLPCNAVQIAPKCARRFLSCWSDVAGTLLSPQPVQLPCELCAKADLIQATVHSCKQCQHRLDTSYLYKLLVHTCKQCNKT